MTHYERLHLAMAHKKADRVPVMCQLSFEHMELNGGVRPIEMYHSAEGFAQAFIHMREMYQFDGILLDASISYNWKERFDKIKTTKIADGEEYTLPDGRIFRQEKQHFYEVTHSYLDWRKQNDRSIEDIDVDKMHYRTDFSDEMALHDIVIAKGKKNQFSVHGEITSPVDPLCYIMSLENAFMAFLLEPEKCKALMAGYTQECFAFAKAQIDAGVDTMKISSPYVGSSFISRKCYADLVLPAERELVRLIKAYRPHIPVYTHTCGFIGDRLDLMRDTGIDGIECMDPPPLGDTYLRDAKKQVGKDLFLKGNMDSVNILLHATEESIEEYVKEMIADGAEGGGYILSSACSVAPGVDPEILKRLVPLAEKYGVYTRDI